MPANINSMAYTKKFGVPWHGLGTPVDDLMKSADAITAGGLDWVVVKEQAITTYKGEIIDIPNKYAMVRQDNGAVLGIVGDNYKPLQNIEAFEFMDSLVRETGCKYDTVGALGKGERIWLLAKHPKNIQVGNSDKTETYLLLSNSHDGSTAIKILPTTVRVVCANTLALALKRGAGYSIRHTENLNDKVEEARNQLKLIDEEINEYEEKVIKLSSMKVKRSTVKEYVEKCLGAENILDTIIKNSNETNTEKVPLDRIIGQTEATLRERRLQTSILEICGKYEEECETFPELADSAWLAYNAVSHYFDFGQKYRGSYEKQQESRFLNVLEGKANALKQQAFVLAQQL